MLIIEQQTDQKIEMTVDSSKVFNGEISDLSISITKNSDGFEGCVSYSQELNVGDDEFEDYFQDTVESFLKFKDADKFIDFINRQNLMPNLTDEDEAIIYAFVK